MPKSFKILNKIRTEKQPITDCTAIIITGWKLRKRDKKIGYTGGLLAKEEKFSPCSKNKQLLYVISDIQIFVRIK